MKTNKIANGISLILVFGMIFSGIALPTAFGRHPHSSDAPNPNSLQSPLSTPTVPVESERPVENSEVEGSPLETVQLDVEGVEYNMKCCGIEPAKPVGYLPSFSDFLLENNPLEFINSKLVNYLDNNEYDKLAETVTKPELGYKKPEPGIGVLPDKGYGEIIDVSPKPEQIGTPVFTGLEHPRGASGAYMVSEIVKSEEEKPAKVTESSKEKRRKLLDRHLLTEKLLRSQKDNQITHASDDPKVISRPRVRPDDRSTLRHGASVHVTKTTH